MRSAGHNLRFAMLHNTCFYFALGVRSDIFLLISYLLPLITSESKAKILISTLQILLLQQKSTLYFRFKSMKNEN